MFAATRALERWRDEALDGARASSGGRPPGQCAGRAVPGLAGRPPVRTRQAMARLTGVARPRSGAHHREHGALVRDRGLLPAPHLRALPRAAAAADGRAPARRRWPPARPCGFLSWLWKRRPRTAPRRLVGNACKTAFHSRAGPARVGRRGARRQGGRGAVGLGRRGVGGVAAGHAARGQHGRAGHGRAAVRRAHHPDQQRRPGCAAPSTRGTGRSLAHASLGRDPAILLHMLRARLTGGQVLTSYPPGLLHHKELKALHARARPAAPPHAARRPRRRPEDRLPGEAHRRAQRAAEPAGGVAVAEALLRADRAQGRALLLQDRRRPAQLQGHRQHARVQGRGRGGAAPCLHS